MPLYPHIRACCSEHGLERISLLLLLVTACGGCWILEQPGSSTLEFYPTFRWAITRLIDIDGIKAERDLEPFQF